MFAPRVFGSQLVFDESAGILLHEDFRFEFPAIEFHVLVRVARVAIFTAEFAAAIWIYGPAERHALGIAMIQNRANGQQKIFRPALGVRAGGGGGEAGNADQFRRGLRSPVWDRSGRGSVARGLTSAVASGCGE